MPRKRKPRRYQNEFCGALTDVDGYKRSPKGLRPSPERWPTMARWLDYPVDGDKGLGLMRRAVKERWAITPELKRSCVNILKSLLDSEDETVQVSAVRSIIQMEKQNQDDKLKKRQDRVALQQIINLGEPAPPDPEYLEWKRRQLVGQGRQDGATGNGAETAPDGATRIQEGDGAKHAGGAETAPGESTAPLARYLPAPRDGAG